MNKMLVSLVAIGFIFLTACADRSGKFQSIEEYQAQQAEIERMSIKTNPSQMKGDIIDINITRVTTFNVKDWLKESVEPGLEILVKAHGAADEEAMQLLAPTKLFKNSVAANSGDLQTTARPKKFSLYKREINKLVEKIVEASDLDVSQTKFVLVVRYLEIDKITDNNLIAQNEVLLRDISARNSLELAVQAPKSQKCLDLELSANEEQGQIKGPMEMNAVGVAEKCDQETASLRLNFEERSFTPREKEIDSLAGKSDDLREDIEKLRDELYGISSINSICVTRARRGVKNFTDNSSSNDCSPEAKKERLETTKLLGIKIRLKNEELELLEDSIEEVKTKKGNSISPQQYNELADIRSELTKADIKVAIAEAKVKKAIEKINFCEARKIGHRNQAETNGNCDEIEKAQAQDKLNQAYIELEEAKTHRESALAEEEAFLAGLG